MIIETKTYLRISKKMKRRLVLLMMKKMNNIIVKMEILSMMIYKFLGLLMILTKDK